MYYYEDKKNANKVYELSHPCFMYSKPVDI